MARRAYTRRLISGTTVRVKASFAGSPNRKPGSLKYDFVGPGAAGYKGTHRVFGYDGTGYVNASFKTSAEAAGFARRHGTPNLSTYRTRG